MSVYTRKSPHPILARKDFSTFWKEEVVYVKDKDAYEGKGILAEKHPLKNYIEHMKNNHDKLIIYARYVVHPMNGNVYWDYEIKENNDSFLLYSYAEND
ncbi:MAG: hypothetical protein OHK0038_18940 [Flammeovirgaceae bacterium]